MSVLTQKLLFIEKNKTATPDENVPWRLGTQQEPCNKNGLFSTILG